MLPVFALGRAQELLLIMEEHWDKNEDLKSIPIYYCSPMAIKSPRGTGRTRLCSFPSALLAF